MSISTAPEQPRPGFERWDRLSTLPKFSFILEDGGVRRKPDSTGAWIERAAAQAVMDDAQTEINVLRAEIAISPKYARMFNAACVDLGLVNEALDLDPNDGGAAPILAAITALKADRMADASGNGEQTSYEHQRAIMEGERNASREQWSAGRRCGTTATEGGLYEAGFTNGWDRRGALAVPVLREGEQAAQHLSGETSHDGGRTWFTHPAAPKAEQAAPAVPAELPWPAGTLRHNNEPGYSEDQMRAALAAQPAVQAEPGRPDIIEKLTYHALERDDLTLDDCLAYLRTNGWHTVIGRTPRQMILQLTAMLAAAPAAAEPPQAEGLVGAVPAGFVLVPVEPTIEMLNAADTNRQQWDRMSPVHVGRRIATTLYRAMLAAAPSQPEGGADAQREHSIHDAAFEAVRKRFCRLQRYSVWLMDGSVRRVPERFGAWVEWDAVHELFDPVMVDAAIDGALTQQKGGAA